MMTRQSHARIQAQITGKGRESDSIRLHELNVLAITRRIHTLALAIRAITLQLQEKKAELKAKRRELRAILQRDSSITEDSPVLDKAGKSDATDAAGHLAENRRKS